jgi:1-acyl-sn-glycerol-3-phosphate acyltransferase
LLKFLPGVIRGTLSYILLFFNTILWCFPLYVFALVRYVGPASIGPWCTRTVIHIAEYWIGCNNLIIDLFQELDIEIDGVQDLHEASWYLVLCNHQTWVDILILQRVFNNKIPFLKFFIKQQLIYTPVIGIAWWALDFPLMKRYTPEFLKKHPELRGKDLEATRRSCEKFKLTPVTILNFLEGTRFTQEKHKNQKSPYKHLLKPRGGGAALVMNSLGERIDSVLNVTIHYPGGVPGFFEFFSGGTKKVLFHVEYLPVPAEFKRVTDDSRSTDKVGTRDWINNLWTEKDKLLESLHQSDRLES